jgi:hypothetical protein
MLKEEHRIRAMAKLGCYMGKDASYVKEIVYQSYEDLIPNKRAIDKVIDEVFAMGQDVISREILEVMGGLDYNELTEDTIDGILLKLGQLKKLMN